MSSATIDSSVVDTSPPNADDVAGGLEGVVHSLRIISTLELQHLPMLPIDEAPGRWSTYVEADIAVERVEGKVVGLSFMVMPCFPKEVEVPAFRVKLGVDLDVVLAVATTQCARFQQNGTTGNKSCR